MGECGRPADPPFRQGAALIPGRPARVGPSGFRRTRRTSTTAFDPTSCAGAGDSTVVTPCMRAVIGTLEDLTCSQDPGVLALDAATVQQIQTVTDLLVACVDSDTGHAAVIFQTTGTPGRDIMWPLVKQLSSARPRPAPSTRLSNTGRRRWARPSPDDRRTRVAPEVVPTARPRPPVPSVPMRLTEFRALMKAHFGQHRASSVAADHVFSALGGRTVNEALGSGENPKKVWAVVCETFDVPAVLHHGLPE